MIIKDFDDVDYDDDDDITFVIERNTVNTDTVIWLTCR